MKKSVQRYSRKVAPAAGLLLIIGVLLIVLLANAAAPTVATYSSNTYTIIKNNFGRGVDTIYSKTVNALPSRTYYVDYYGPSTDDGTDFVPKYVKQGPVTSTATFEATHSRTTLSNDNSGAWQVRYHHNPNYGSPAYVVVDDPTLTGVPLGNTLFVRFHLVDRDGNTIMTSHLADLKARVAYIPSGGSTYTNLYRLGIMKAPKNNSAGWVFDGVTGKYSYYTKTGVEGATTGAGGVITADSQLLVQVTAQTAWAMSAAEADPAGGTDAFGMGALDRIGYYKVGAISNSYPCDILPVSGMNPMFFTQADVTSANYDYYFDLYDVNGNTMSAFAGSWSTRTATAADDYDGNGQAIATGQVYAPNTGPNTTGHWMARYTLPSPGKYNIRLIASQTNTPAATYVINFGASHAFTLAGDVTPPGNITWGTVTPSDNRVTLNWTNPTTDQGGGPLTGFSGILILRKTNTISDVPLSGQMYTTDGVGGPKTIGTSTVVYASNGTSFVNGNPCVPSERLVNGTTYYYKAFSFDSYYNYSTGTEVGNGNTRPIDAVAPAPVAGAGFIEGNQQNTVTWTNPADCDFAGVVVRYRTDGVFPSVQSTASEVVEGDGKKSYLAGVKNGGTPGVADSFTHSNLVNGVPYYYTIWAKDDEGAPNWSASASPSDVAVPHDVTSPGAVSDLQVVPGSTTAFDVTLQWTATGDDNGTGNASKYEIRFYTEPVTAANWDDAWHTVGVQLPTPLPAGSQQSYTVSGLAPLTDYYFAIKVGDEVPNWSGVSNSPTSKTLCNPELTACNQCHLLPPDDDLPGAHPRGSGNIGAHYLPIHTVDHPENCNVCHFNGQVWRNNTTLIAFNHQNDRLDMNGPGMIGNAYERSTQTGGTLTLWTTTAYKYKNYSSGVGYKVLTGYCTNTYCHGAGLSSPRWGLDHIVCGEYCHEMPPATGRHVKHYHPGQYYVNFGPSGVKVSGYTEDDGSSGWTGTVSVVNRDGGPSGNRDPRYATFLQSSNASKTFNLPNGTYYISVCVGDSAGEVQNQFVQISGNGGASWTTLVDNFSTAPQKLFKKIVDHQFFVINNQNLKVRIGDGSDLTKINFMIVNATPEAPKENNTLLQNTPSEYGFACGKCHVDDTTQAKHASHVNSPVQRGVRDAEIAFDGNSFPKNPFGNYTQVGFYPISTFIDGQGFHYTNGRSCLNTYCHGNTLNAGGSNTNPQWKDGYIDTEGASLCGACHDSGYGKVDTTPLTNISTGSHKKHVTSSAAYRYECAKCHNHTVGFTDISGKINIKDKTHHVNGDVDVIFDPNDNTMKFGRYSSSIKTCDNVYCHSNGLLDASGQPFWATQYSQPVWASGSKTCNYCHGNGRADGMPHYNNSSVTPNSHEMHVDANNQACSKCHYDTVRSGLEIVTSVQPSAHVDGEATVVFDSDNQGGSYNHSNLECTNTYCHGLSAPPVWGGTVTCGSCHGVSPTNPNPGSGKHYIHNQGNHDDLASGTANRSGSGYYDFSCYFCHFSQNHGSGEVEKDVQTAETNFNNIDVVNGYNNAGATYTRAGGTLHDANQWHYSAGTCTDRCHSDGKGGPPNRFVSWTTPSGVLNCSGCHSGTATAQFKMSSKGHSKHVWSSVYRFTCGDCHNDTSSGNGLAANGRAYHVNGRPDTAINTVWGGTYGSSAKTCSTVGCHFNGDPSAWGGQVWYVMMNWTSTAGSTCSSCHATNRVPGGDGSGRNEDQTLSHNHGKHLDAAAGDGYGSRIGCSTCHRITSATNATVRSTIPTNHNNGTKDIVFWTNSTAGTSTRTKFFNMTGPNTENPQTGYWGSWNPIALGSASCTVICHSDGRGGNPLRFPNWSTPEGTYGCGSCHGDKNTLATGAHAKHLNGNIGCSACHRLTADGDAVTPYINASGFNARHVNGTANDDVKMALSYGGTYNTGTKQCSTVSCHGGQTVTWDPPTPLNCGSCHESPPRYSQHFAHYSSTTLPAFNGSKNSSTATDYRFGCGKCHVAYGGNPIHHAQGNVKSNQAAEVSFDNASTPANPLGSYTTQNVLMGTDAKGFRYSQGTCRNIYCHSDGKATPTYVNIGWNTASVTCTSCHGGAAAKDFVALGAPHGTHVGTDFNNVGCAGCHKMTVNSNTNVNTKFNHVNGGKDVSFAAFGTVTGFYAAPNCRNTYCHSDGNGGSKTIAWNTTPTTCSSCHDYKTPDPEIATGAHKAHIGNAADAELGSFKCYECHVRTVDSADAVLYAGAKHVDNAKDVYFRTFNTYTGAMTAAKTCRNNYCHSSGQKSSGTLPNISTPKFRVTAAWNSGTLYGCNACHGQDSGASAYGEPNYANRSTAGKAWYNSHGIPGHVSGQASCFNCHANTVASDGINLIGVKHLDGFRNISFTAGGWYDTASKRCGNTVCHGPGSIRWGGSLPNDCQSCHADMGAGAYTGGHSYTGKHQKHTDSATYKFACELCHAQKNASGNISHATGDVSANQAAQMVFHSASTTWRSITYGKGGTAFRYIEMDSAYGVLTNISTYKAGALGGSDPVNANRKWTQGRCANIWCHSSGFDSAPAYVGLNWNNAATNCRSCHGGHRAPKMATYRHPAHMDNGTLGNFGCKSCHNLTLGTSTTITNYGQHVNGARDVNFAAMNGYTGFYTSAKTCRNNYCHSSGQKTDAPAGLPKFRTAADWTVSTDYGCTACHGADSGFTSYGGEPNYANMTTALSPNNNGHYVAAHVSRDGVNAPKDCSKCHRGTADVLGNISSNTTKHINGAREVNFRSDIGGTYDSVNKTCSGTASSCHGAATMRWGGLGDCAGCHQVTAAETTDTAFVYGNAIKATVNFYEFTSVGHGKKGTYRYSGKAGANKNCDTCHSAATPHGAAGNPYRLISTPTYRPGDLNGWCLQAGCHSSAAIQNHQKSITGGTKYATWFFTPKCVDCHDPHGDNGGKTSSRRNYAMIHSYVNYSGASSAYGVPSYRKAVDFPANIVLPVNKNRSSYVRSSKDGLCQVCHRRGYGAAFNRSTNNESTHNSGQLCTDCHKHDTGFKGAGDCKGCHATAQNVRRAMQPEFDNSSSHHIVGTWSSITKTDCAACHAEGNQDGSVNSTYHTQAAGQPVNLKQWTGAFNNRSGSFSVVNYTAGSSPNSVLTPVCLSCHNDTNKSEVIFSDGQTPNTYAWDYNSVGSKYSNTGTTPWGKFNSATYNVVPADVVNKSYSPHGNPGKNKMVMSVATFSTYSATAPVQCYDCHNAHASNVTGGAAYASGNNEGGIIKTTGSYTPRAGGSTSTKNAYSANADMCFDCHLGDQTAPANYTNYGLATGKTISGSYYDRVGNTRVWTNWSTTRWSTSDVWRGSFAFKDGTFKGGHFGNSRGYLQSNSATMGTKVDGKCTACHDPHGTASSVNYTRPIRTIYTGTGGDPAVTGAYTGAASTVYVLRIAAGGAKGTATYQSSTDGGKTWAAAVNTNTNYTGATGLTVSWSSTGSYAVNDTWTFTGSPDVAYLVPALKGTWMTSPYKEDRPPRNTYTSDTMNGGTARLSAIPRANDFTAFNPVMGNRRLWDDSAGGTSSAGTTRQVGGPAPRGNADFKTGSWVPGFNIPAVQGGGFGQGPRRNYGYSFGNITGMRGWNGYFIDENTFGISTLKPTAGTIVTPTAMTAANANATPGRFAGLCLNCHAWSRTSGIALSNVTSANLATGAARIQTKPHEAVSGLGSITVNLFTRAQDYNGGYVAGAANREPYDMHGMNYYGTNQGGYDGSSPVGPAGVVTLSGTYGATDPTANSGGSTNAHYYRWGVSPSTQKNTTSNVQSTYHQFPCSKCHTPHVSRLPRLMKTNCLDNDNVGTAHTTMGYVANGTAPNTTAASLWGALYRNVACHSTKIGVSNETGNTYLPGGWNNKTPW